MEIVILKTWALSNGIQATGTVLCHLFMVDRKVGSTLNILTNFVQLMVCNSAAEIVKEEQEVYEMK